MIALTINLFCGPFWAGFAVGFHRRNRLVWHGSKVLSCHMKHSYDPSDWDDHRPLIPRNPSKLGLLVFFVAMATVLLLWYLFKTPEKGPNQAPLPRNVPRPTETLKDP